MTRHDLTELEFDFSNCPESGNLHLWLPDHVFGEMDAAIPLGPIRTREDFGTAAILYALYSLREATK
jgi:hypothetical protein